MMPGMRPDWEFEDIFVGRLPKMEFGSQCPTLLCDNIVQTILTSILMMSPESKLVRQYLIDVANGPEDQYVSYDELAAHCNQNLKRKTEFLPRHISSILIEVMSIEHVSDRPLLVFLAREYKFVPKIDYRVTGYCLEWNIRPLDELADPQFASLEAKRVFEFWRNPDNYAQFRELPKSRSEFFKE